MRSLQHIKVFFIFTARIKLYSKPKGHICTSLIRSRMWFEMIERRLGSYRNDLGGFLVF